MFLNKGQLWRYLEKIFATIFSRKTIYIFVIILTLVLFYQNVNLLWHAYSLRYVNDMDKGSGLILKTPGCKIPKLDPFDPSVKHLISLKKPYVCKGDPVFMITYPNSTIILNETVLKSHYKISPKNVSCSYNVIYRDMKGTYQRENYVTYGKTKKLQFGVPLGEEFIQVHCKIGKKKFLQYVPFVPIKPEVEKRASTVENDNSTKLNVVLIGIDSVSKLNFLRHFNRTHDFLVRKMSAFDMKGYTKVGDNTFPNLIPLLTGHFVEHYWNETLKKTMFFDRLDFIWKDYSKKGFRTFYAEDSPYYGTFQYSKRGFENPPTDYYYRPFGLAVHDWLKKNKGDFYCVNNQMEVNLIYGYLKDFVKTMGDRAYFAFSMVSVLTHDYLNYAGYADEPTYLLLKDLWDNGVMNKSMVVIFSDHGIRFGSIRQTYIGKFEERMPFMYISLPKWFLRKNKIVKRNLKTNKNRLITLFDVHETLYELLNPEKPHFGESKTSKGLSLFGEISENRTCETANILPHWCPCQVYQYVPPYDPTAFKAASAVVHSINYELSPYKDICARLALYQIEDVRIREANNLVVRFVKHENDVINRRVVYGDKVKTLSDYLVTLITRPGGGMFEGTVRLNPERNNFQVLGISRINKYGNQSICINSHSLRKYCFCK